MEFLHSWYVFDHCGCWYSIWWRLFSVLAWSGCLVMVWFWCLVFTCLWIGSLALRGVDNTDGKQRYLLHQQCEWWIACVSVCGVVCIFDGVKRDGSVNWFSLSFPGAREDLIESLRWMTDLIWWRWWRVWFKLPAWHQWNSKLEIFVSLKVHPTDLPPLRYSHHLALA